MHVSNPCLIDTFKDEYHLKESLDEARDMMKYKPKKNPNRLSIVDDSTILTDDEERNEQIAEKIARKYGLAYFQQSCIAGNDSQMKELIDARKELSVYMTVGEIEEPFTPNGRYTKCFSFYS